MWGEVNRSVGPRFIFPFLWRLSYKTAVTGALLFWMFSQFEITARIIDIVRRRKAAWNRLQTTVLQACKGLTSQVFGPPLSLIHGSLIILWHHVVWRTLVLPLCLLFSTLRHLRLVQVVYLLRYPAVQMYTLRFQGIHLLDFCLHIIETNIESTDFNCFHLNYILLNTLFPSNHDTLHILCPRLQLFYTLALYLDVSVYTCVGIGPQLQCKPLGQLRLWGWCCYLKCETIATER